MSSIALVLLLVTQVTFTYATFEPLRGVKDFLSPARFARQVDTCIIGAGLSGLSTGVELEKSFDEDFLIIDSTGCPGGRIKTDEYKGYLLDRGFQVFIERYPQVRSIFDEDYSDLQLKPFLPGAMVRYDDEFHLVSDPFRRPQDIIASLISPIGSLVDKIVIGIFSVIIRFVDIEDIFNSEARETNTLEFLETKVSDSMIERFFNPFYQGIFLSPLETQSSAMFQFVFKMFTEGSASLPAGGIGQVGQTLANKIPNENFLYNTTVLSYRQIQCRNGDTGENEPKVEVIVSNKDGEREKFVCNSLVIATDPLNAEKLVNENSDKTLEVPDRRSSICLYFGFQGQPPVHNPMLILNGENQLFDSPCAIGSRCDAAPTINNICFPSQVSKTYAPEGMSLASITVVPQPYISMEECYDDETLESSVRMQLKEWFPDNSDRNMQPIDEWELLRIYRIPYAQPAQVPPYKIDLEIQLEENIYVVGDHRGTATLNGAIESGRRAAKKLIEKNKLKRKGLDDEYGIVNETDVEEFVEELFAESISMSEENYY